MVKRSGKLQISIPKDICKAQQWRVGQKFLIVPKGKGILMIPLLEDTMIKNSHGTKK